MIIRVFHDGNKVLAIFDDPLSDKVSIKVIGSIYVEREDRDPVVEALRKIFAEGTGVRGSGKVGSSGVGIREGGSIWNRQD